MQILGIDLGFGFTKATDGTRDIILKSVIGEAEPQYVDSIMDQGPDEGHVHLELDEGAVFVGELAERTSSLRTFTLDHDRFVTESSRTLTLAAASLLANGDEPVRIVTGLPISTFRAKQDELASRMHGRHSFVKVEPNGQRRRMSITVEDVRVIAQPFGSLYESQLDGAGRVADRGRLKEKIGIVDVGFQTSDFTVADGGRFLERASSSTDAGIGKAFAAISGKLREKSGVTVELYRLYEAMLNRRIKVRGNTFDLSRLIDHVLNQLATDLASEINRLWADEWDIDAIMITGGGGSVLAPYLTPLLQGNVLPVQEAGDARMTNVRGFHKYGLHIWASDPVSAAAAAPAEAPAVEIASDESASAAGRRFVRGEDEVGEPIDAEELDAVGGSTPSPTDPESQRIRRVRVGPCGPALTHIRGRSAWPGLTPAPVQRPGKPYRTAMRRTSSA